MQFETGILRWPTLEAALLESADAEPMLFLALSAIGVVAVVMTVLFIVERRRWRRQVGRLQETLETHGQARTSEQVQFEEAMQAEQLRRQRVEQVLRDSEALYSSLVENLSVYVLRKDRQGRLTFASRSFCELCGKSPEEILGQTDHDLFSGDQAEKYRRDDARVLESGELFEDLEKHEIEGSVRWMRVLKTRLNDPSGEAVGTQAVFWDVTDRVLAEEAVRESERRKQAIFDAAMECMIIIDADGKIAEFNRAAEKTFGYRREDIIGAEMADLFYPNSWRERQRNNLSRYEAADGEASMLGRRIECPMTCQDGREILAELTMQPIPLKGRSAFMVFVRDVTDRKQAELALKNSEALYHSLVDHLPMCLLRKDLQGRFTFANRAFLDLAGYKLDDLVGKTDLDLYPPDLAAKYRHDDRQVIETGELFDDIEEHQTPGSDRRYMQVLKTPVLDSEGETIGTQLLFWDVTDRKRAEEEIRLKNRDLETLLYVTSHDLREPLRAIENFSKLVCSRYSDRLDATGQNFLKRVVEGAQRLDRLLDDVLTLSRAGRMAAPNSPVDTSEIVAEVLNQLKDVIQKTQARITVAEDLPVVHADRRWARQAVYNLVSNAIKFSRPGEPPEVEIGSFHPDGEENTAGLVVRDRGPGIKPEHAERIFDLFQRTVGREVEGTGAGLAIVRQIAERHGGTAWARPRDGGGSEFFLSFRTDASL